MTLYVKNMVCDRCIMVVKQELRDLNIPFTKVELGEIALLQNDIDPGSLASLQSRLASAGFELLDDRKATLVSQIKSTIIKMVHAPDDSLVNKKLSVILSEKLQADYNYLSGLFSSVEGITIEKYVILQRVERAKELLAYNELTLNEIADTLGYSSVQHLSQQFKKITGLTPSQYKQEAKAIGRKPIDQVGN